MTKLTVTNTGRALRIFFDEDNRAVHVRPGQTKTVSVLPQLAGRLRHLSNIGDILKVREPTKRKKLTEVRPNADDPNSGGGGGGESDPPNRGSAGSKQK